MSDAENPSARITCLDGIRAVSIAFVLLSHFIGTLYVNVPGYLLPFLKLGGLGVRIFFVISGFLITSLLISEYKKSGTVSLPRFYLNRTFRIFPAFYLFIAVVMAANAAGLVALNQGDFFHAVTYTTNYHYDRSWNLGHLWSLAVEEQFYLLWPVIFCYFGMRGGLFVSSAYLLVGPLVRVLTWQFLPESRVGIGEAFQTVADSIAMGCVFAFLKGKLEEYPRYLALQRKKATSVALLLAILFINHNRDHISFMYLFGETIINLCIALFIGWCLINSRGLVASTLNSRPLVFVGTLSYSLYLWQQPFFNGKSDAVFTAAPQNLLLTLGMALLSYRYVETPFLQLRQALAQKWFRKPAENVTLPAQELRENA